MYLMLYLQCCIAGCIQGRSRWLTGDSRSNTVVEEITRPAFVLLQRDAVPALLMLRNRFVPAPVLNKIRRGTKHVELIVKRDDRFLHTERKALRPRAEDIVMNPIL